MKNISESSVDTIWVVTPVDESGARGGEDQGGILTSDVTSSVKVVSGQRQKVEVTKLKREIRDFLQAMRETLSEADQEDSIMRLEEVELTVEVNGEGKVSLLGVGGKVGGKGGLTFKFKRKS